MSEEVDSGVSVSETWSVEGSGSEMQVEQSAERRSRAMGRFIWEVQQVVGRSSGKNVRCRCHEQPVQPTAMAIAEHVYKQMLDKKLFQCCWCAERKSQPPAYCSSILVHTESVHRNNEHVAWFIDYRPDHEDALIHKLRACFSPDVHVRTTLNDDVSRNVTNLMRM